MREFLKASQPMGGHFLLRDMEGWKQAFETECVSKSQCKPTADGQLSVGEDEFNASQFKKLIDDTLYPLYFLKT